MAVPAASRRLFRLPSVQALLIQFAALGLAGLALFMLRQAGIATSAPAAAFLQGALAAALSRWRGQAAWWQPIHFLFLPAALAMLSLQLPPWLFLATFLAMLALYWSTFRTQVPFYASGSAAWHAVAAELPQRPLRIIDIGSGLGGLALDLAARRPDCRVEGIELAPLPWLISRLRRRAGGNCRFLRGDYQALDFADYDVVFAYLSPAAMPQLWSKARAEMRPGALLLSHEFAVPEVPPQISRPTRQGGPVLYGWRM
jgi:SAM-dependent methyltransferase